MAVRVGRDGAEQARARFVELVPEGFEEQELGDRVELVAYVETRREDALRSAFAEVSAADVAPGWEDAWRAFHRPVRIGPLWVGPPWERPDPALLSIVIDPGRAFGTGSHPTTRLCLELLLELPPGSALDLGCGSGVLAIAAARLGHEPVVALDLDEAAVEATRENAARNGVPVRALRRDVLSDPLPEAELALANLEQGLIHAAAARVRSRLLVASGYRTAQRPAGWERLRRLEVDGWAAELFERRAGGPALGPEAQPLEGRGSCGPSSASPGDTDGTTTTSHRWACSSSAPSRPPSR